MKVYLMLIGLLALLPADFRMEAAPLTNDLAGYSATPTIQSCQWKGFKLYGKVQYVESFPDIKIQFVNSFPDLKVQFVESFPDQCGKWQVVTSFPDFKVQVVESFPDLKVQVVNSFPGE
jgi:hypothetical protein